MRPKIHLLDEYVKHGFFPYFIFLSLLVSDFLYFAGEQDLL
jgi:hypothetical protein